MPRRKNWQPLTRVQPLYLPSRDDEYLESGCNWWGTECLIADDDELAEQVWRKYGGIIFERYVAAHPAARPWAWWKFDAPEMRRRVGGVGTPLPSPGNWFGQPARYAADYDLANPPKYETEFEYLKRHGLLLPGETSTAVTTASTEREKAGNDTNQNRTFSRS